VQFRAFNLVSAEDVDFKNSRYEQMSFLSELGFVAGEQVSVVSESSGNLIIHVKDCRIALDKSMASRIQV